MLSSQHYQQRFCTIALHCLCHWLALEGAASFQVGCTCTLSPIQSARRGRIFHTFSWSHRKCGSLLYYLDNVPSASAAHSIILTWIYLRYTIRMKLCIHYVTDISAFSQPYPMVTKRRCTNLINQYLTHKYPFHIKQLSLIYHTFVIVGL